ncbi:hypothetical protein LBMAG42_48460 [Deltaproteobacteria bacterium]|nr:hypothetical protein LBMAG42_48460 [Deltaproteobacteria bacterium]
MSTLRPLEVVRRGPAGVGFEVHAIDRGAALLQMRPTPLPAELKQVDDHWVLVSDDRKVYLRLGAEDHHIWALIDGKATVAEIATTYFLRFGALHIGRVTGFIQILRRAGLIEVEPAGFLRRRFAHVSWLRREWAWDGIHAVAERVWAVIAPVATPWNLPIFAGILIFGAVSFAIDSRWYPASDALRLGLFLAALVAHVVLHELAHAVAVVAYGRRVRGMAVGLRGIYVDTTDMYLGSRQDHAVASLAGPAVNLALTAVAAVIAVGLPVEHLPPLRAIMYAGLLCGFLTGWPFLFDNDAAHAIGDLVQIPNLRGASWEALRTGRVGRVHALYILGCVLSVLVPPLILWL